MERVSRIKYFTLIEVLITFVLFTLLIGTATFSYKNFSELYQRENNRHIERLSEFKSLNGLADSIESIADYYVLRPSKNNSSRRFYAPCFKGSEKELVYVSNRSLLGRPGPVVVRLQLMNREGVGGLFYDEVSLEKSYLTEYPESSYFNQALSLLLWEMENIDQWSFRFKGYESSVDLTREQLGSTRAGAKTFNKYDSISKSLLPLEVHLNGQSGVKFIFVLPGASTAKSALLNRF